MNAGSIAVIVVAVVVAVFLILFLSLWYTIGGGASHSSSAQPLVFTITSDNSQMRFDSSNNQTGQLYVVNVPNGTYSGTDLAAALQNGMQSSSNGQLFVVSWDGQQRRFSATAPAGTTFNICGVATGSIYPTIGFDHSSGPDFCPSPYVTSITGKPV